MALCGAPSAPGALRGRSRWIFPALIGVRLRSLRNMLLEALFRSPFRVLLAFSFVLIIWAALYGLFFVIFHWLGRTPLESRVTIPLIFNFFFLAMFGLLIFSNAVIAYGALFTRNELPFLMTSPARPRDVVLLKYFETLLFSSWSLVLLGMPLMTAMAEATSEPDFFYLLFIAFFLAFIPIPGAIGLLLAWAVARYFPSNLKRALVGAAAGLGVGLLVWMTRSFRDMHQDLDSWLRGFMGQVRFLQSALWPNVWVTRGIDHATSADFESAFMYLAVTVSNALFLSLLAVWIVSRDFHAAYDRAVSARGPMRRNHFGPEDGFSSLAFAYLPMRQRLIAAKDLRAFFRDPLQWSQLVILFGLMTLYLPNIPSMHDDFAGSGWRVVIPWLNLCAVSLILATFTSRFVFPLVSLEGQQFWLVGLLPLRRREILRAKFCFAMTVTLAVALFTMLLAMFILQMNLGWSILHLAVTFAVCYGLCSLAVGIGARWPMFNQTNAARIASGLGGTVNLIASVILVVLVLALMGYASWDARFSSGDDPPGELAYWCCLGALGVSLLLGDLAMLLGIRHLESLEV